MKILVTGSKGFIGRLLVFYLRRQGHKVYEFDKYDFMPRNKVDVVYHLAANANAFASVKHPFQALQNIDITYSVLEWMRKKGVKNIIYTSSREVYSLANPYGASKLCGEALINSYCNAYNFNAISVRLSNICGKGNHPHRFIEQAIEKAKANKDITIFGKNKVLNFVHVDDCVIILSSFLDKIKGYQVKEIASSKSYLLTDVAKEIIKLTSSKSKIIITKNRSGETMSYVPKLRGNLVTKSLKNIIKKCI